MSLERRTQTLITILKMPMLNNNKKVLPPNLVVMTSLAWILVEMLIITMLHHKMAIMFNNKMVIMLTIMEIHKMMFNPLNPKLKVVLILITFIRRLMNNMLVSYMVLLTTINHNTIPKTNNTLINNIPNNLISKFKIWKILDYLK